MIDAIRNYLALISSDPLPANIRLLRLAELLDQLLAAYHQTPKSRPSKRAGPKAPPVHYSRLREAAMRAFPELRPYRRFDPIGSAKPMISDPFDVLADIGLDLTNVVWLWDNVSRTKATWYFRLTYLHWGTHARSLSNYLLAIVRWRVTSRSQLLRVRRRARAGSARRSRSARTAR